MAKTYDEFEKLYKGAGVTLSDYDMDLARRNPDAGIGIINYKKAYGSATSDQARAYANQGANSLRQRYGGYSGGTDGSSYLPVDSYFGTAAANTGSGDRYGGVSYGVVQSDLPGGSFGYMDWKKSGVTETPGDFDGGSYGFSRQSDYDNALDKVLNRGKWSYDADSDPAYQAARKQYLREADRATEDTMGKYAAMTGGMPSTAAVSAASQAGDYYRAKLNDTLGDYIDRDYQRYIDDVGLDFDRLSALRSLDQDERSRFETDRAFDYNQFIADINHRIEQEDKERAGEQAIYNGRYVNRGNEAQAIYDNAMNAAGTIYQNQKAEDNTAYDRAWDEDERKYTRDWNEENRDYERTQQEKAEQQAQTQYRDAQIMDYYNALMEQYNLTLDPAYRKQALELLKGLSTVSGK